LFADLVRHELVHLFRVVKGVVDVGHQAAGLVEHFVGLLLAHGPVLFEVVDFELSHFRLKLFVLQCFLIGSFLLFLELFSAAFLLVVLHVDQVLLALDDLIVRTLEENQAEDFLGVDWSLFVLLDLRLALAHLAEVWILL